MHRTPFIRHLAAVCALLPCVWGFGVTTPGRELHAFELEEGECAGIARKSEWGKEEEEEWDYHVKVDHWLTFGHVTMHIHPSTVEVKTVWAANFATNIVSNGARVVTVELTQDWQEDYTFDMAGTGKVESISFTCSRMQPPITDCLLEPKFTVINNFMNVMTVQIPLTWQVGATVDITFQTEVEITDEWNAERVIDEDHPEGVLPAWKQATFRLMYQARNVPKERRNSFGFNVKPALHDMPNMKCTLIGNLSPPPPPSLPEPSPPPPEIRPVDEQECYLGVSVLFGKPPVPDALGVSWELDLSIESWLPGTLVTIDFLGESWKLKAHPLMVESVDPPDSLVFVTKTHHSVSYSLAGHYPGSKILIIAYGLIEGVGRITCCCAPPPPPPPFRPPSPRPRAPPSPRPQPPPPPPYEHDEEGLIQGRDSDEVESALEMKAEAKMSVRFVTMVSGMAFAFLIGTGVAGQTLYKRWSVMRKKKRLAQKMQELAALRKGGGMRPVPVDEVDKEGLLDNSEVQTKMLIQLPDGERRKAKIDFDGIESIGALQKMVVRKWVEVGGSRHDSLMLRYEDAVGDLVSVSRSTPFSTITRSPTLQLLAKTESSRSSSKKGGGHPAQSPHGSGYSGSME